MKVLCLLILLFFYGCIADEKHLTKRSSENSEIAYMPSTLDSPILVNVSIYFLDISELDVNRMEFTTQMYFRQSWQDKRLPSYVTKELGRAPAKQWIFVDLETIWKPDLFFVEERRDETHDILLPNSFIRINDDGNIMWSKRVTPTIRCLMDFRAFPHDQQKCNFSIESYGFNASHIDLSWALGVNTVGVDENSIIPDYNLLSHEIGREQASFTFGNYTRLSISFNFQRRCGFFVTKLYLPHIFLVLINALTFWIDPKAVWARLSILISVLTIIVALALHMNSYIPVTAYTKAIDVWIGFCTSFAFLAFLEYILVFYVGKLSRRASKAKNDPEFLVSEVETLKKEKDSEVEVNVSTSKFVARSLSKINTWNTQIDVIFRYVYPVLFAVFNLIYWCAYAA